MDPNVLARKQLPELRSMAAELRMRGYQRLRKADLIEEIVREANRQADPNQRVEVNNGSGPSNDRQSKDDGAADAKADGERENGQ